MLSKSEMELKESSKKSLKWANLPKEVLLLEQDLTPILVSQKLLQN